MTKFPAIEGLRGWLAWTVVLAHLAYSSGIYRNAIGQALERGAYLSVLLFVVMSGFVITHLIVERPEPYFAYLIRRFMRIFPIFALTCIFGYFAYDLEAENLMRVSYAGQTASSYGSSVAEIAQSDHQFFWSHAIAHLVMLHGVISNSMLPFSEEAFNAPAWSLSLEWQFYLIAPFAVLVALRQKWLPQFAFLLFLAEIAMRKSSFGQFTYPSFLPAASGYFAVGIASRLAYARLHCALRDPMMFYSLGVVLLPLVGDETKPIVAWMMLVIGLEASRTAPSDKFGRWLRYALESRPVRFLGSRSYSTYLCHMAVIAICHRLWLSASPQATPAVTFLALIFMTVPLTLVASELLYRAVERPGIALGSTIAAWIISRSAAPLPFPRRA